MTDATTRDWATSSRVNLQQVTLCAITSVNVAATIRALEICLAQLSVARCILLTDAAICAPPDGIEVIPIERLTSAAAYSDFVLSRLVDYIETSHCLIVQWDGHVLDATRWQPAFLDVDYIGASWPQFSDGQNVGNGGFSLRSRRLMLLCRAPSFQRHHPEDLAICRTNRAWLERQDICFAQRDLADQFSAERDGDLKSSFGYHGVFLMPEALGVETFWKIYLSLDDLGTIRHDFTTIVKSMVRGKGGFGRTIRMISDLVRRALGK